LPGGLIVTVPCDGRCTIATLSIGPDDHLITMLQGRPDLTRMNPGTV
jgi:hypothetical protein